MKKTGFGWRPFNKDGSEHRCGEPEAKAPEPPPGQGKLPSAQELDRALENKIRLIARDEIEKMLKKAMAF
jgi:hypothetical protein